MSASATVTTTERRYSGTFYSSILYALRKDGRKTEFRIQEIHDILASEKGFEESRYRIRNALEELIEEGLVERVGEPQSARYRLT